MVAPGSQGAVGAVLGVLGGWFGCARAGRVVIHGEVEESSTRPSGYPSGADRPVVRAFGRCPGRRRRLEAVLDQEAHVVPLVEDLAPHAGIKLPETANLTVLLGDKLLVEGRDFDVELIGRQVEVGGKALGDIAVGVPVDVERGGLVVPIDLVEIEEPGELAFGVVGEGDGIATGERLEVLLAGRTDRYSSPRALPPGAAARNGMGGVETSECSSDPL